MKRLLLNLLCLLFAYPCFAAEPIQLARMSPWVAGSVTVSGSCSCTATGKSCTGADPFAIAMCYYADRRSLAQEFTASSSGTICKASLRLKKSGDTGNNPTLQVCIYSDESDVPNAIIGTCSTNIVNVNSLTTSYADVEFTGIEAAVVNSSKYHIAVASSAQCTNELVSWAVADSGCEVNTMYHSFGDSTPSWSKVSNVYNFEFTTTMCE